MVNCAALNCLGFHPQIHYHRGMQKDFIGWLDLYTIFLPEGDPKQLLEDVCWPQRVVLFHKFQTEHRVIFRKYLRNFGVVL